MNRAVNKFISGLSNERCSRLRFYSATAGKSKDSALGADASEVEFHSNLSSVWWDPNGPMKPLHRMNAIRIPFIRNGLIARGRVDTSLVNTPKVLQGQKLLDVGCGAGILTEGLAALNAKITAIDLGEELIRTAREHIAKYNPQLESQIDYKVESIGDHAQNNREAYDAVVVSEVLEHISDKESFLKSCVESLKPGGSIFITTISKSFPMWFAGVLLAEYVLNLVPRGTHHWDKMISSIDVQRKLDSLNCQTVVVNGYVYEFWRSSWTWINSTNMCYALQAIKSKQN